jgi:hypothetical protein
MALVLEATQREPTVATKLAELRHLHRPATTQNPSQVDHPEQPQTELRLGPPIEIHYGLVPYISDVCEESSRNPRYKFQNLLQVCIF